MIDWLKDYWFMPLLAACVLAALIHGAQERREFMVECMSVHRRFECSQMWRATDGVRVEFKTETKK